MVNPEIFLLRSEEAAELSRVILGAGKEYSRHFIPFDFGENSLRKILEQKKKDCFFGIKIGDRLAGFYMLRGFDEGYETPSYGVWIAPELSGKGLARLTIYHAISFCRLNGIKKIMLKVHPDNSAAKRIYEEAGFTLTGKDKNHGHLVYHKVL